MDVNKFNYFDAIVIHISFESVLCYLLIMNSFRKQNGSMPLCMIVFGKRFIAKICMQRTTEVAIY